MSELFPYQREGVAWLAARSNALLADEPGLGKSAQAIRACDAIGARKILVLCPASLRVNWAREFSKFQKQHRSIHVVYPGGSVSDAGVVIASYDYAARNSSALQSAYDVAILDEVHYLKNRDSRRSVAVFGENHDGEGGIAENCDRIYALSGTPAPNNSSELYPMVAALWPDSVEPRQRKYWGFVSRYCRTKDNGFGPQIVGSKNTEDLRKRLAPFILRRKKEDVLPQLPTLRIETLYVDGVRSPALSALSNKHKGQIDVALATEQLSDLQKIAPHVAELRKLTGMLKVEGVCEVVSNELEAGGKIVLFAQHRDVIEALTEGLKAWGPCVLTGSTPPQERQEMVDRFQRDAHCQVFIGQLQAAGVGLTLTAASEAIIVESSWVPAENEQACMRIHRIGQRNACRVRFATLADSLDEKINQAVMRKAQDIAELFD